MPEIDICRSDIVRAFVIEMVVAVIDEDTDMLLQFGW
jgi:hypothetical protein